MWWVGPHLVSLAFDSQRASAPFYGLYLQHQPDPGEGGRGSDAQQASDYNVRLLQLLAHPVDSAVNPSGNPSDKNTSSKSGPSLASEPPARVVWQISSLSVITGSVEDEWSNLVVARFNSGRQFVRLVTSPVYRKIRDTAPRGRRVVVGSSTAPLRPLDYPAALLLLVEGGVPQAMDEWVDALRVLGGEVIWDAPVAVLEPADPGRRDWDALVLVGFDDAQTLAAWSFSVEAQTTNALLGAKSEAMSLWLLQHRR